MEGCVVCIAHWVPLCSISGVWVVLAGMRDGRDGGMFGRDGCSIGRYVVVVL